MAEKRNSNGVRHAETHYNIDLSELFGNFNLWKRTHKDGTVVYEISSVVINPDTGVMEKYNDTIWPRNAQLGDEMVSAPDRPTDAFVTVGWFDDDEKGRQYGIKYLTVTDGKQTWKPMGDKRPFSGPSGTAEAAPADPEDSEKEGE